MTPHNFETACVQSNDYFWLEIVTLNLIVTYIY